MGVEFSPTDVEEMALIDKEWATLHEYGEQVATVIKVDRYDYPVIHPGTVYSDWIRRKQRWRDRLREFADAHNWIYVPREGLWTGLFKDFTTLDELRDYLLDYTACGMCIKKDFNSYWWIMRHNVFGAYPFDL